MLCNNLERIGKYLHQKFRLRIDVLFEHRVGLWVFKSQNNIENMADK